MGREIEEHRSGWLVLVGIVFVILTTIMSGAKLLWFDEFITLYIAKLNRLDAIWDALARAMDPNPPLTHVLVMWSMRIFGEGPYALRLPSVIATLIAGICVYKFLRPRVPAVYAISAMCILGCTRAFEYAFESRGYALLVCFAAVSLLAWTKIVENERKLLWSVVLALALAAGISSNYYAVLAFFPIAAGEAVRTYQRRRIEWSVWLAMVIGAVPLFFYLPLIRRAIQVFAPYAWNKPSWGLVEYTYLWLVDELLYPIVALLGLTLAVMAWRRYRHEHDTPVLPRPEQAALAVFLLAPVIGYVIAIARAGMYTPRFVIATTVAVALVTPLAVARLARKQMWAGALLLIVCGMWWIARAGSNTMDFIRQRRAFATVIRELPSTADRIAVPDALLVVPLHYYAPKELASKIVYPIDLAAIRRYQREDSPEQNLWNGRGIYPLAIVPARDLVQTAGDVVPVVANQHNWMMKMLAARGVPIRHVSTREDANVNEFFSPLARLRPSLYEAGTPSLSAKAAGNRKQNARRTTTR